MAPNRSRGAHAGHQGPERVQGPSTSGIIGPTGRQADRVDQPHAGVQRVDARHLRIGEPQLQGLQVAPQVGCLGRRGDYRMSVLQRPGERDLRGRGAALAGDVWITASCSTRP